jgi:hypothetical protein
VFYSPLRDAGRGPEVWHRCRCGRSIPLLAKRCSARTCTEFGPIWARDTRRRLLENLSLVRLSVMFSVTAPGRDLYPFDPTHCRHGAEVRCSGKLGCRVNPAVAAAFNRHAGKWWSELHRAAATRAKRKTGYKGKVAARVWEKQKRGLAHVHGVISVGSPAELAWAKAYVDALRELAPAKGFGFVDGWHKVGRKFWPGDQAGAYLSSYFVRGRGRKAPITENVLAGDLPRLVVYVGRHLTARSCCTMRNLRNARRAWAWQQGLIEKPPLEEHDLLVAFCLLHRHPIATRAP